tara:strand:- start:205 stop:639 length:435 start_codon:yes stop_codon:yes gene_type:complete
MSWLYKFLLDVVEKKDICTKCHCGTCGASEFRATLISKLKIYNKIPNITKLSKTNEKNRFIAPVYFDLEKDIQRKIVNEISDELRKLTDDQISRLEELRRDFPVLRCLFVEFKNSSDYLYSLLVGTPAEIYLKDMIEHHKSRSL